MRIVKKILIIGVPALLVLLLILWIARFQIAAIILATQKSDFRATYLSHSPEDRLEKYSNQILEDAATLGKIPFFATSSGGSSDASIFLNPLVGWGDEKPGKLKIDEELAKTIAAKNFSTVKIDWPKWNLDFSWMTELTEFDHWSFDNAPPEYGDNKAYVLFETPIPNYGDLIQWAKLRLLKGRDENQVETAIHEVRQLASLIMTTENLVGAMSVLAIFGAERTFVETLTDPEKSRFIGETHSRDLIERARRYYWAQVHFADLRLTNKAFEKFAGLPVGICQRVHEAMYANLGFRRIFTQEDPEGYRRLNELIDKTAGNCRSGYLRRMWKDPDFQGLFPANVDIFSTAAAGKGVAPFSVTITELERNPRLAVPVVYILLNVGNPNMMKRYEKPATEK